MSSHVTSLEKNQKENSENHNYLHWPHFLDSTNKNFYVINASRDGADNGTIFRNLKHIFKQNSLKRDWSDTIVFVQWSAVDRHSINVEEEQKWLLSSTHTDSDHIFEEYYKNEYTEEKALQNTLDNISNAEKFLNSKGVKYRMFFGWNVLDDDVDFKVNDIDISSELKVNDGTGDNCSNNYYAQVLLSKFGITKINTIKWSRQSDGDQICVHRIIIDGVTLVDGQTDQDTYPCGVNDDGTKYSDYWTGTPSWNSNYAGE